MATANENSTSSNTESNRIDVQFNVPGLHGDLTKKLSDEDTCDKESLAEASSTYANYDDLDKVSCNCDINEIKSFLQKHHEFRFKLDHLLHTRKFQIGIIILVLVDVVSVIATLCIHLGILENEVNTETIPLKESDWPYYFQIISVIIRFLFVVEFLLKMYSMDRSLLKEYMEVVDGVIIIVTFIIGFAFFGVESAIGLLIVLRLWRVCDLVYRVILSVRDQGHQNYQQQVLNAKTQARLDEIELLSAKLTESLVTAIDRLKTYFIDCSDLEEVLRDANVHVDKQTTITVRHTGYRRFSAPVESVLI